MSEKLLTILTQFTGGAQPEDHFVRLGLAAFFWLTLIWFARHQHQYGTGVKRTLIIGFSLGFVREVLLMAVYFFDFTRLLTHVNMQLYYPPVEHLLSSVSVVWIIAAFLGYLRNLSLGRRFLAVGLSANGLLFILTFPAWVALAGVKPATTFGQTWYDWAWHFNGTILTGCAIFMTFSIPGWPRSALLAALSLNFLEDILMLFNLDSGLIYAGIYNPVRHAMHLAFIPLVGYIFIREQWERQELYEVELQQKKTELGNLAELLEDQVQERTSQLTSITNELNIILENVPVGICKVIDRKQVWVNHKIEELFQYTKQEIANLTMRNLYPSDESYEYQGGMAYPVLAQGCVYEGEQVMVRKDGSHVLLRLIGKAIDPSDPCKGSLWQLEDISLRKQAEDSLRESEEKYRVMVEAFDGFMYICSSEYRIEFMNDKLIRRTGRDATGEHCYSALHDRNSACEWCVNNRVFAGESVHWELKSPKDGRWYEVNNAPIFNANDTISKQAMITDITDRKQAEEALRKSEALYHSLVETSQDIIWRCDTEGRFTYLNIAASQVFGYETDEMLGRKFSDFQDPVCAARDLITFNRFLGGDLLDSYESEFIEKSGDTIHLVINAMFMSDDNGNIVGASGTAYDITQRKQIEDELRLAKIAAESANRAKSQFLATMSHEIRTPMNALMGNLTLLGTTPLSEEQKQCLRDCNSASKMQMRVINDILDLSKIESDNFEMVNESFSPVRMLDDLVGIYSSRAREKQLCLNHEVIGKLPDFIFGDRQRLSQSISNLLSNAIKFTLQGKITLSAYTETSEEGELQLVVTVSDTGIGIAQEQQSVIFDSFTQLDNFSTRRHVGTGLGLAISKRLVEMMKGNIAVSSIPDKGSIFTISIPITSCESPEKAASNKFNKGQTRRILLADDEPFGRSVVTALLERYGYSVMAVEDGKTVLDTLQRERFDILLTDISMPDMDGTQVTRIIRSGELAGVDPLMPIIAMTAHAFPQDRERFISCGINDYIAKPIMFEELLILIEETCAACAMA